MKIIHSASMGGDQVPKAVINIQPHLTNAFHRHPVETLPSSLHPVIRLPPRASRCGSHQQSSGHVYLISLNRGHSRQVEPGSQGAYSWEAGPVPLHMHADHEIHAGSNTMHFPLNVTFPGMSADNTGRDTAHTAPV